MDFIKRKWKEISIVVLALLFIVNCNGKGNYKRKYEKQIKRTEFVKDSLSNMYSRSASYIDSLNTVIRFRDTEIKSLKNEISIYVDQNKKLANQPVVVKVESKIESNDHNLK